MEAQIAFLFIPQGYVGVAYSGVGSNYAKGILPNRQGFDNLLTGFLSITSDQKKILTETKIFV